MINSFITEVKPSATSVFKAVGTAWDSNRKRVWHTCTQFATLKYSVVKNPK